MTSKLVVSADVFNSFENSKLSILCHKRNNSSASKSNKISKKIVKTNTIKSNIVRNSPNILKIKTGYNKSNIKTYKNNKLNGILPKTMNNKESHLIGEAPATSSCISASVSRQVCPSLSGSVEECGSSAPSTSAKKPLFFIKNSSGKPVPLVVKNSVLLKTSDTKISTTSTALSSTTSVDSNQVFIKNNFGKLINIPRHIIISGQTLTPCVTTSLKSTATSKQIVINSPLSTSTQSNTTSCFPDPITTPKISSGIKAKVILVKTPNEINQNVVNSVANQLPAKSNVQSVATTSPNAKLVVVSTQQVQNLKINSNCLIKSTAELQTDQLDPLIESSNNSGANTKFVNTSGLFQKPNTFRTVNKNSLLKISTNLTPLQIVPIPQQIPTEGKNTSSGIEKNQKQIVLTTSSGKKIVVPLKPNILKSSKKLPVKVKIITEPDLNSPEGILNNSKEILNSPEGILSDTTGILIYPERILNNSGGVLNNLEEIQDNPKSIPNDFLKRIQDNCIPSPENIPKNTKSPIKDLQNIPEAPKCPESLENPEQTLNNLEDSPELFPEKIVRNPLVSEETSVPRFSEICINQVDEQSDVISIADVNRSHIYFNPESFVSDNTEPKRNEEENIQKYEEIISNPFNFNLEIVENPTTTRKTRVCRPLANTKNIIINNQLVPVSLDTKFKVETGTNPLENEETNDEDNTITIITSKSIDTKASRNVEPLEAEEIIVTPEIEITEEAPRFQVPENLEDKKEKKVSNKRKKGKVTQNPADKFYQIQVPNIKNKHQLGKKPKQVPAIEDKVCVDNSTQTPKNVKDFSCQTEFYIPQITVQPIEDECPNIPQLVEYLLGNEKYNTGIDDITKTDIMNNSLKFMAPESESSTVQGPKPTLKERLFYDLRDCVTINFMGDMPIHTAVLENKLGALKRQCYVLRLRNFTVDVENNYGQTALQFAIANNRSEEIISTLLANGANISIRDNMGNTLLHSAVLDADKTILELILHYFNNDSDIINVKNDEGLTPLMIASIEAKPEIVDVLLKFGADPNIRDDKSGRTALFHSVELNNTSIIGLLLQNKADPKIRNFFGLNALDAAKDLNSGWANAMEKQVIPSPTLAKISSPKPRTSKRQSSSNVEKGSDGKKMKLSVVPKQQKVDMDSFEQKPKITKKSKRK